MEYSKKAVGIFIILFCTHTFAGKTQPSPRKTVFIKNPITGTGIHFFCGTNTKDNSDLSKSLLLPRKEPKRIESLQTLALRAAIKKNPYSFSKLSRLPVELD